MKSLSKEQRNRLVLIAVAASLLLGGIWYGPVRYLGKRLDKLSTDLADRESKLENARRLVKSKAEIEQNLADASARVKTIEQTMATGDLYAWMILTVNKFRAAHQIDIPQFGREVTGEVALFPNFPYRSATFTVRGYAHFHDLGKFIADFENTFPYMRLENLEIERLMSIAAAPSNSSPELLAFKLDIVSLINPTPL